MGATKARCGGERGNAGAADYAAAIPGRNGDRADESLLPLGSSDPDAGCESEWFWRHWLGWAGCRRCAIDERDFDFSTRHLYVGFGALLRRKRRPISQLDSRL